MAEYILPFPEDVKFHSLGMNPWTGKGKDRHPGKLGEAIDFALDEGTPVLAARSGTVTFVKDDSNVQGRPDLDKYLKGHPEEKERYEEGNNVIIIKHGDGTSAGYYHLKYRSAKVRKGENVKAGKVIALSGNTGYSDRPHLHFEVLNDKGISVPVKFKNIKEYTKRHFPDEFEECLKILPK